MLSRLLKQMAVPKARPRARRKYATIANKLYVVGDCLELVTEKRTYRGVVCALHERRGQCDCVTLVMDPKTTSTRESFEGGQYFGHFIGTPTGDLAGPHVIRLEHRMLLREGNPFRRVAHVELDETRYGWEASAASST